MGMKLSLSPPWQGAKMDRLTTQPIDPHLLSSRLHDPSCGGVAVFIGKVRNYQDGKEVVGLSYEAYPSMTNKIFCEIIDEAKNKFGVLNVEIAHRVGDLKIGEIAVWVGVESVHRNEAFLACRYTIDELKRRAPLWKKEHYREGKSRWVECQHQQDQ